MKYKGEVYLLYWLFKGQFQYTPKTQQVYELSKLIKIPTRALQNFIKLNTINTNSTLL